MDIRAEEYTANAAIGFVAVCVLEEIGVERAEESDALLEKLIERSRLCR